MGQPAPDSGDLDQKMSDTSKYAHWLLKALAGEATQGVIDHVEHLVTKIDDLERAYYREAGSDQSALF